MFGKCKKSGLNKASARVVDGKLILFLPEATSPVVWQMDLSQAKASALEVRQSENIFTLTLKTPKGETIEIASFDDRALSVDGLMAASRALENAHGQIRPAGVANDTLAPVYATEAPRKKGGKFMPIFLTLVVLFVLFIVWSALMPIPVQTASSSTSAAGQSNNNAGVPLSADAYLQSQ